MLEVTRAGEAMPVRVGAPLSRGTLEQIYVAVRLALVDAIDGEARLPLFLDELFAHWDAHRLDALVRVLGAVEGRQVVVSTCHAALADRLERSCGARVIELAGPGGVPVRRPLAPAGRGDRRARAGGPDPARSARGLTKLSWRDSLARRRRASLRDARRGAHAEAVSQAIPNSRA